MVPAAEPRGNPYGYSTNPDLPLNPITCRIKTMSKFKHFCLFERRRIEKLLKQNKSRRAIASVLDRSVSTVVDEIKRNTVNGRYQAEKADHKAYVKRKYSKLQCLKVAMDKDLWQFVEDNIKADQSPEGIAGRLKHHRKDLQYASSKAIYKFVESPHGRLIEKYLYSQAVKKKGGPKRGKAVTIDGRTMIDARPKKVETRSEFGHFEADFIESGKDGHGSLLVIVERKTRYPFLRYLEDRTTEAVNRLIQETLIGLPIESLTIDNDISFQKHAELSALIEAEIYFCHPQSPHEKGTVENRNKAIRRYVKKRTDLSQVAPETFAMVEDRLRDKYLKCLSYETPREVFERELKKTAKRGMIKMRRLLVKSDRIERCE